MKINKEYDNNKDSETKRDIEKAKKQLMKWKDII